MRRIFYNSFKSLSAVSLVVVLLFNVTIGMAQDKASQSSRLKKLFRASKKAHPTPMINRVSNLLINDEAHATIEFDEEIVITFDFASGASEATIHVYFDVDGNGTLDTDTDISITDEDEIFLVDNSFIDEDSTEGSFQITLFSDAEDTPFSRITGIDMIFVVDDGVASDEALLTVNPLETTYSISGTVTQPANTENLIVVAFPLDRFFFGDEDDDGPEEIFATVTDGSGDYTLNVYDDDDIDYGVFTADFLGVLDPGWVPPDGQEVFVNGAITGIDFEYIVANAVIEGTVTDDDGTPLKNIGVEANLDEDGPEVFVQAETDTNGNYTLRVIEGDWEVNLFDGDLIPDYLVPGDIEVTVVSDTDTVSNIDFKAYEADAEISGVVEMVSFFDRHREGAGGIRIEANSEGGYTRTRTRRDGSYTLHVSSDFQYRVEIRDRLDGFIANPPEYDDVSSGDDEVDFEIIFVLPHIVNIHDIPRDQGLQVRVVWSATPFEFFDDNGEGDSEETNALSKGKKGFKEDVKLNHRYEVEYSLWRAARMKDMRDMRDREEGKDSQEMDNVKYVRDVEEMALDAKDAKEDTRYVIQQDEHHYYIWDYIVTVPSIKSPVYSYVAPTLHDSTEAGIHWSVFIVIAHVEDDYDTFLLPSYPDRGYSVDNLRPGPPAVNAKHTPSGVALNWMPVGDEDLVGYEVYRSDVSGFTPSKDNFIGATEKIDFLDTGAAPDVTLYYIVASVDDAFNRGFSVESSVLTTGVESVNNQIPETFGLSQNFPNPFNPETNIRFQLANSEKVLITVYNLLGQEIRSLVNEERDAGYYQVNWDGRDNQGLVVPSGIYFYQMEAGDFKVSKRMLLLK